MHHRGHIHVALKIGVAIVEGPILEGRVGKEGKSIHEVGGGTQHQGVGGR